MNYSIKTKNMNSLEGRLILQTLAMLALCTNVLINDDSNIIITGKKNGRIIKLKLIISYPSLKNYLKDERFIRVTAAAYVDEGQAYSNINVSPDLYKEIITKIEALEQNKFSNKSAYNFLQLEQVEDKEPYENFG